VTVGSLPKLLKTSPLMLGTLHHRGNARFFCNKIHAKGLGVDSPDSLPLSCASHDVPSRSHAVINVKRFPLDTNR
jgi:hypothetical protein